MKRRYNQLSGPQVPQLCSHAARSFSDAIGDNKKYLA
jgi:hypothetical protein